MHESEISSGQFVEPGKHAPIVFQIAEQELDLGAHFVERPVGFSGIDTVGTRRNNGFELMCLEPFNDVVGIVSPIGEDSRAGPVGGRHQQRDGLRCIAGLAGTQGE